MSEASINEARDILIGAGAWMSQAGLRTRLGEGLSIPEFKQLLETLSAAGEIVIVRRYLCWSGPGSVNLPLPDTGEYAPALAQATERASAKAARTPPVRRLVPNHKRIKRTGPQIRAAILTALREGGPLLATELCKRAKLGPVPFRKYTRDLIHKQQLYGTGARERRCRYDLRTEHGTRVTGATFLRASGRELATAVSAWASVDAARTKAAARTCKGCPPTAQARR